MWETKKEAAVTAIAGMGDQARGSSNSAIAGVGEKKEAAVTAIAAMGDQARGSSNHKCGLGRTGKREQ